MVHWQGSPYLRNVLHAIIVTLWDPRILDFATSIVEAPSLTLRALASELSGLSSVLALVR